MPRERAPESRSPSRAHRAAADVGPLRWCFARLVPRDAGLALRDVRARSAGIIRREIAEQVAAADRSHAVRHTAEIVAEEAGVAGVDVFAGLSVRGAPGVGVACE